MNSKFSRMKSIALIAALVAGVSGIAHADDNDMSRFGGEGYAYFHQSKPVVDTAHSAWSQDNPHGLSERQFQALSDESQSYQLTSPAFDRTPSSWRESHPHGLTERELQAMSNEDPVWQYPLQSEASAMASTGNAAVTKSAVNEPFSAQIATFFHVSPAGNASTK